MILKKQLYLDIETIYIMFFEGFLGESSDLIDSQEKLDSAQPGVHFLWARFKPDGLNISLSGIMLVFAAKPGGTAKDWKFNIIIDTDAKTVYMRLSVNNGNTWRSWQIYNGTIVV